MEWLALIVPLVAVVVLRVFFASRMVWWEFMLPLAATALVIIIGKACADKIGVRDTEYWGGWVEKAVHYERWDERVACSHIKWRTVTHTDSKGRTYTTTEFDGYQHLYDVDDHPERWEIRDSNGITIDISDWEFAGLTERFGGARFVDMKRNYHRIDGDAWVATWPGDWETLEPVTTVHTYENRVARSSGVYRYPEVDPSKTPVFGYPKDANYNMSSVGFSDSEPSQWKGAIEIDKINAALGARKKVHIWVLVWEGPTSRQVALDQEAYWKGGNKNELVICINVRSRRNPEVLWCHVFSWSKSESLKSAINSFVAVDNRTLDLAALATFLDTAIESGWEKRNWHDFDYLSVEPPTWAMVVIWVVALLTTVGVSYFCVVNEIEPEPEP